MQCEEMVKNRFIIFLSQFSAVKRMLEHYARKYESPGDESPLEKVQINIQNEKSVVKVPKKLAHRIGPPNNPGKS